VSEVSDIFTNDRFNRSIRFSAQCRSRFIEVSKWYIVLLSCVFRECEAAMPVKYIEEKHIQESEPDPTGLIQRGCHATNIGVSVIYYHLISLYHFSRLYFFQSLFFLFMKIIYICVRNKKDARKNWKYNKTFNLAPVHVFNLPVSF